MEQPRYFAVLDPLDPDRMLYWSRSKRGRKAGQLRPWPQNRDPWPLLYSNMPDGRAGGLHTEANRDYAKEHWAARARARAEIVQVIEIDPQTAAVRFSQLHTRCCCCGRVLTEEHSKTYGIGPECRKDMPPEQLARFTEAVGRAHAEVLR